MAPIIAVDCESVNDKVVFLGAADEHGREWSIQNSRGLSTAEMWAFLLSLPKGIKCGFFFNYDASMMLQSLPTKAKELLVRNGRAYWRHFRVEHIPSKRLSVSDREIGKTFVVWDVSGWYPYAFAKLLEEFRIGSEKDRAFVRRMKLQRADFENSDLDAIGRYCLLECKLLAEWVRKVITLHEGVGIRLKSYCGAGSTAGAIYRDQGFTPPVVPAVVDGIAADAFFGGRNEMSVVGEWRQPVLNYDINSAYPHAITQLPDAGRAWRYYKIPPREWWGFAFVQWNLPKDSLWGPFPVRPAGKGSSLVYPISGSGWYHAREVLAARAIWGKRIRILGGWVLDDNGDRPFAWVAEMAAERLKLKAAGDPRAYVLKVGLNSLYGKLAQRTGRAPYRSVSLAAAVTSTTRAQIIPLLASGDVLTVSTDGVICKAPISGLTIGGGLGEWSLETAPSAFLAQCGVYWVGDKIRTRGFESRKIDYRAVVRAWRRQGDAAMVAVPIRRFVGYRLALKLGKPELGGKWQSGVRHLSLSPMPRRKCWRWSEDRAFCWTRPATVNDFIQWVVMDELFQETDWGEMEDQPDWLLD